MLWFKKVTTIFLFLVLCVLIIVYRENIASRYTQESSLLVHVSSSVYTNPIEELKRNHPHCFSNHLFEDSINNNNNSRQLLSLDKVGRYKLIGRNLTTPSALYSHQCPYYLKDRYNCARNNSDILDYGDNPTDWKLILVPQQQTKNLEGCNLWGFVHDLGGPIGVANALAIKRYEQDNNDDYNDHEFDGKTNTSNTKEQIITKKPFVVLMMGNSHLRQIFEALACGWSSDITDYRAITNSSACYSIACMRKMAKQGKFTFDMDEIGVVSSLLTEVKESCLADESCQPSNEESIGKYYRQGVTLPMQVFTKEVDDDVAMVEFGNSIQFYNMFRPYLHKNLTSVIEERFHLDPVDVDMLVFNNRKDEELVRNSALIQVFTSTGVWQERSLWSLGSFRSIQERDIGRWFGADNPWITNIPDGHACMPGPADDEANLLMFLIFAKARIICDVGEM